MVNLETLKKEASQVQEEVERTDEVMKEVDEISSVYKPLALACSKIYFAMERLAELHFLYHFSLNFFLDIVRDVLDDGSKKDGSSGESRVQDLLDRLFRVSFRRIAQVTTLLTPTLIQTRTRTTRLT